MRWSTIPLEQLLEREDLEVVDITTHPEHRAPLIAAAIKAGKHILSQKPFVTDLAVGRKLVAAAKRKGVKLAVNQNGRWAAHVSYARQAIAAGLLGQINDVDLSVHWDHNVFAGTPFDKVHHLMLFDFGIHWFDMVHCYLGDQKPKSVFAAVCHTVSQETKPPLSAHALVEFPHAQASLLFRGDSVCGCSGPNRHCRNRRHADQRGAQHQRTACHVVHAPRCCRAQVDHALVS